MPVFKANIRAVPDGRGKATVLEWTGLPNGAAGEGELVPRRRDRSVQVTGNFSGGGSVRIEGSNDGGTTWSALHDPGGAILDITSANEMFTILDFPERIRPRVTAGDGSTSLNVYITVGGDQ